VGLKPTLHCILLPSAFCLLPSSRVSEVWIYDGKSLAIKQLQDGDYITSYKSQFFSNLPIPEIAGFLQQAETIDYLELVKAFRAWVRRCADDSGVSR